MPTIESMLDLTISYVTGIRWHEPSQRFIAEIGYHEVNEVAKDGSVTTRRVRTTHYLGSKDDPISYKSKFRSLKDDWKGTVSGQREQYDAEQDRRRREGLPPLPRFKPVWPKSVTRPAKATAGTATNPVTLAPQPPTAVTHDFPDHGLHIPAFAAAEASNRAEILKLTVQQAYDRYVEQQRLRIGLLNGKGIERNTFDKHVQNLTLGLALNSSYSRLRRPIDASKRLMDLTVQDYESFVRFWCDPANVKSERTSANYTGAFRRMITSLKVPTPQEFNDLFKMRLTQGTKIVRYDPDLLRFFLQHEDGRVRMISLMCLNFGYYQVDIARLRFEHITDFDGNPYQSGDMFITKRRERTRHQNKFTTTVYCWPETQRLMEQHRAVAGNPYGSYFLSQSGRPYSVKTVAWIVEQEIRANGLGGKFSLKQFRKIGASQIKALSGTDAMHQYKANALGAADQPYILEDFTLLTGALKKFRDKLMGDGVLTE